MTKQILLIFCCCFIWLCAANGVSEKHETVDDTCDAQTRDNNSHKRRNLRVPGDCGVVMAPSDLSGWGLFVLKEYSKNDSPLNGDVVIPVSDAHPSHAAGMRLLIHDYLWDSHEVGQQYEGQVVMSVLPGTGMLCNGHARHYSLLAEREPSMGDAGVTRDAHPAAGSFTLYHNLSFYLQRSVNPGEELLVTYGESWFQERKIALDDPPPPPKELDWLHENGYCVDNLEPGITVDKGRGAFATRNLPKDSVVVPVPVLPLTRQSLQMVRQRVSGELFETRQLLLNYCLGHPSSSLLFYPYSPHVNLINHSSEQYNVRLQWAPNQEALEWPLKRILEQRESPGLLLELVALRDIREGEEIMLDYGIEWQDVWDSHVEQWKPSREPYVPSFNFSVDTLRTEKELRQTPYHENLFTSCFYKYLASEHISSEQVTMDKWKGGKGVMDMRNLRPCAILEREGLDANNKPLYTVQIRNRFGLQDEQRLPKGRVHVVTHVPRHAIRFSNKLYTTDPHLEGSFRHEIGLPYFPPQWMDLFA